MSKSLLISILFFLFLLISCATKLSEQAAMIKDIDIMKTNDCTYVGDVDGTSGLGELSASTGISNAKNEAREKAAKLGATHIAWKVVNGGYSPFVSGQAYQCNK